MSREAICDLYICILRDKNEYFISGGKVMYRWEKGNTDCSMFNGLINKWVVRNESE